MTDAITLAQGESHSPRARLLVLTSSGAVAATHTGIITGGSVTYDRSRDVRRSGSVTLVDKVGTLTPTDPSDELALGAHIRLERGIYTEAGTIYTSLGTFSVTAFDGNMDGKLELSLQDTTDDLRQDMGTPLTIPARTRGAQALRLLWEPVLGSSDDWALGDDSAVVGSPRTYAEDDERLGSAVDLMSDLGLQAYADRMGVPVLSPLADPTTIETTHTFVQGPDTGLAVSLSRSGEFRRVNRQVVVGEPADGPVVRGEATITDPAHPWHQDRIGIRTAPIHRSAAIASRYQARRVAQAMLLERIRWSDAVGWTGVPDITLEAGDAVSIVEPQTQTAARYRIERVTLPIVTGAMSFTASRITQVYA